MFDHPALRRFVEAAPVCVAARATLERLLRPAWLDELFRAEARHQYESTLLFSTLVGLMGQVVLGGRRSVHEAYRHAAEASVSVTAVYDKLNRLEPGVSAALVRRSAAEVRSVLDHLPAPAPAPAPAATATAFPAGREWRVVDGNHLAGTQSRIEELRHTRSGPLPGQALVVLDPRRRLLVDVVPCEDAHAQERSLVPPLLGRVNAGEVWVADRNFCTTAMLCGVRRRGAHFVIRQHASTLTWESAGPWRAAGRVAAGRVDEQPIRVWDPVGDGVNGGAWVAVRRVRLTLARPTRGGDRAIHVLTDLPAAADASAAAVADAYGGRWQVEGAFGELTAALRCEVETLGYPRAALFAFCLALLAYNAVSLVRSAVAAVAAVASATSATSATDAKDAKDAKDAAEAGARAKPAGGVSFYQMAREVAATAAGMEVAVPPDAWATFGRMTPRQFARALLALARRADARRYRKCPRGPKRPRPHQTHGRRVKHVSTARVLARRRSAGSG